MGNLNDKVALVTGAARGQGRSHAVRLAEEGADIVALDLCADIASSSFPLSTPEDLAQTAKAVESLDRRVVTHRVDVRDQEALDETVSTTLAEFGRLDVVVANAGVMSLGNAWELSEAEWQDMVDVNLTGVWRTTKAAIPPMIDAGRGGSIILTSSVYGLTAATTVAHYTAAKHGVVGLAKSLAMELAPHSIRVNTVNPTFVNTDMIHNDALYRQFFPDSSDPNREQFAGAAESLNLLPVPWVEPRDISHAVAWLAGDESRYVTGISLPVDAGFLLQHNAITPT